MKRKLDILSFLQANSDRITIRGRSVSAALLQDEDLLSADSVDLTDCGLTEVPSELAQLSKLRRLTLSRNRIRTFSSISNLNGLTALTLTMMEMSAIPPEIQYLSELTELYCSRNRILELPNWIGNLSKLSILNARNNRITLWSSGLWRLKRLKELDVSENFLTSVPDEIASLNRLEKFYLSGNGVLCITPKIGALKRLESLAVSGNRLRELPREIASLPLKEIWTYDNPLQSPPASVALKGVRAIREYFGEACEDKSRLRQSVFISYAKEDAVIARKLYRRLKAAGFEPWLDEESLLPGQDWEHYLQSAIRECQFFLALLSTRSVGKTGYVQKEMRKALELCDLRPAGEIYVVPVRLEDCRSTHLRLSELQWVDLFPSFEKGFARIIVAMNSQING